MRRTHFTILRIVLLSFVLGGCREAAFSEPDIREMPVEMSYTLSRDGVLEIRGSGELQQSQFLFEDGDNIEKIVIHEGITVIGKECFSLFSSVELVELPPGLKEIEEGAFEGDVMLQHINMPDTVEKIGNHAFMDCVSLEEFTLPVSLKEYKTNAVQGCYDLRKIVNCSRRAWKLCTKDMHGIWYCAHKEAEEVQSGQEVWLQPEEYGITYDLNGGRATAKLPEHYLYRDGAELPDTVEREGYSFVGWDVGEEPELCNYIMDESKGNKTVVAAWIKFQVEKLTEGSIRAFWNMDLLSDQKNETYCCMIRYSKNGDMSDYEFIRTSAEDTEVVISELEKGERYYIEYAIIDSLDNWETIGDLPWKGKTSIVVI